MKMFSQKSLGRFKIFFIKSVKMPLFFKKFLESFKKINNFNFELSGYK
jgi:hypothetical protein